MGVWVGVGVVLPVLVQVTTEYEPWEHQLEEDGE